MWTVMVLACIVQQTGWIQHHITLLDWPQITADDCVVPQVPPPQEPVLVFPSKMASYKKKKQPK